MFEMIAFSGLDDAGKRRKGMARHRTGRKMQRTCGCEVTSVKRKGGGRQPAIKCEGNPMFKFISREKAKTLHGEFCTEMLKPIR